MVLRSLQPKIARHVVRVPFTDFSSLVLALYDVEDGISRGLWTDFSPTDVKGKKPLGGQRSIDVSAISSTIPQLTGTHSSYAPQQYRPRAPHQSYDHAYMSPTLALPYPTAQGTERPLAIASTRPPQLRMDLHCTYHQGLEHEIDHCTALRHAIQDLIDQGLVHLGQPSVTTNSLLAHTTHAVPPPTDSMHSIDFAELDDHIHMLSWDESEPEPILSDEIYEMGRVTLGPRMSTPFRPVPEAASVQTATTPYVDNVHTSDVQYVIREGRIRIETTTTLEGLIHMVTAGRATCIGSDHTRPLYISISCSGHRVPSVLLDNGSALNICPLATAIAIGYAPSDLGPSTQIVRAYDSTRREVMGTLEIELLIAGAIPSSLHHKVKFIHNGLGFFRDFVAMSFDQHGSTVLSDGALGTSTSALAAPSSPDHVSLMTLYFSDEIDEHGTFSEIGDIVDGGVPHDEYVDEMLAMSMGQIEEIVQPELASPFDLFGVSVIEIAEEIQTTSAPEFADDVIVVDDLFDGPIGPVEGASDFVDPPLSFDVLSGFVSRFNDVHDSLFMDLSIFEYPPISYDITLSAPSSPTSQIFDIDDEIAQHDSNDDSSSASNSDPIDREFHLLQMT
ncbi:hypothetical protein AAG906_026029 [Vitis piasezkii]